MRVLYIDPGNDSAVTAYATMLQGIMDKYIDSKIVGSLREMKAVFTEQVPQIVHVHGCWSAWTYRAVNYARRHGARVVITTHGQLEPWIMKERLWKEKLPKLVLFQRRMVSNAYAVVVMGQMEENSLKRQLRKHLKGYRMYQLIGCMTKQPDIKVVQIYAIL